MHPKSAISRASIGVLVCAAALLIAALISPGGAGAAVSRSSTSTGPRYLPGVVVVGYRKAPVAAAADVPATGRRADSVRIQVLRLPRGTTVAAEIRRLRGRRGVSYAVPDYLAHVSDAATPEWIPNDPGTAHAPQGWEKLQWNFLPGEGVNAPQAWANLLADHRPGGRGVVVAILDTGVAYRKWHQFRESPDFIGTRFADPYDFVAGNRYPLDREGHGTFVAGTVAEATNNGFGLTGPAYGATIMPVRVLDETAGATRSRSRRGSATRQATARR